MENISFEDKIVKLEEITLELEKGEIPLEKSLTLYEDGVKLAAELDKELKSAKLKIEEI